MSLVKTLAKVAIGVAVAKGAAGMMRGAQAGSSSGGGMGGLLGSLAGGAGGSSPFGGANSPAGGGLQDMMGSILGGAQGGGAGGMPGGLGGLLEQLGGAQGGGAQGGLGGILGGLAGAAGAGGAGGILGSLAGALTGGAAQSNDHSFGDVLNSQFDQNPAQEIKPSADQEAAAGLMLRAMIQATKADGELDKAEQAKLIEQLGGDVDAQEAKFLQAELQRPVDIQGLAAATPKGLEQQVYAMSVLGIDLDSQAEAQYLHQLAQALSLNTDMVNAIHGHLGVPSLYT